MKYIKSNTSQNILKDSDINLSESFNNQKLSDVLVDYRNELNSLKSNVKWLAKYGGVGGSGSGGSNIQNVKLKYKVDVIYNDLNGNQVERPGITSGSTCEDLLAESGYITFRITLVRCMPNTSYSVAITYGDKTDNSKLNASDLFITRRLSCNGNQKFIIKVWSSPEDISEVTVPIFTKFKEVSLNFVHNDTNISNGGIISEDIKGETNLIGTITNYLPDKFSSEFISVSINGNNYEIQSQQIDIYNKQFIIPAADIVSDYGIYEIILNYTYNEVSDSVQRVYIYKDENPFVYCYGKTNTVYTQVQNNPKVSNFSIENIYLTIYPGQSDSSTTTYTDVKCTISYEGLDNVLEITQNYTAYNQYNVSFQNIYQDKDFINSQYKQITITFTINSFSYTYYLYITKIDDLEYIFKYKYNQGGIQQEELFYNAIHACTAIPQSLEDITTFPLKNVQSVKLVEAITCPINRLANRTSVTDKTTQIYGEAGATADTLIKGYVTNYEKTDGGDIPDVLLSFGLKYQEFNIDLPILSIKINEGNSITLYSNKIVYNEQTYTRWCIPNENKYHLIQLYYKPCYTINGSDYTNKTSDDPAAFIFCIDGIFETSPITLNSKLGFEATKSSITYYPGNWEFNFMGVASFNAKPAPNTWANGKYNPLVLKYVLDFDPIIPANYYQAYYKYTYGKALLQTVDKSIYQLLYSNDGDNPYGINYYKNCNNSKSC